MSPVIRVIFLVWPAMVAEVLIGAWMRSNFDLRESLYVAFVPYITPLGALLILLYLLRGGIRSRYLPQKFWVAFTVAMLTWPVVAYFSFILGTIFYGD